MDKVEDGAEIETLPGSPSDDYALNAFLLDLSEEITNKDFKKLKFLCSGDGGIPKGVLEEIRDTLEFFEYWKQNLYLSRYNLIHLQSWMWQIRRKDLFYKMTKFAQRLDNRLHLFTPKPEPENGYKYIQFHVGGKAKDHTRANLEQLRTKVSQLMCVPPAFVYIAGIEPHGSIVLTFMVPESSLEFLSDLEIEAQNVLKEMHVDAIHIDGKIIVISEDVTSSECVLIQELTKLHEKNIILNKSNEELNIQIILLRRENAKLKSTPKQTPNFILPFLMNIVYELHRLQKLPGCFVRPNVVIDSLRKQSAQTYYLAMLGKVRNGSRELDTDLLCRLLEAHTMVIMDTFRDQQLVNIKMLVLVVQDLMLKMANLQRENEEQSLRLKVLDVPEKLDERLCEINVGIRLEFAHALARVSQKLRPRDRAKLLKEVEWSSEEKEFLTKNNDQYLLMIFIKNISETGDPAKSLKLLHDKLKGIDRKDLVPKIEEYVQEYQANIFARVRAQNAVRSQQLSTRGIQRKSHECAGSQTRNKKKHNSGELSGKGNQEPQKEDQQLSEIDYVELRSMVKENHDMLKSLAAKQELLPAYPRNYNSFLAGYSDQPPAYSDL